MQSFTARLIYIALEAACAATGIAAFIALVRKVQIALGVKDEHATHHLPSASVR